MPEALRPYMGGLTTIPGPRESASEAGRDRAQAASSSPTTTASMRPGLEALIEIATQLSSDVWVVAPEFNQSGAGHSLSLIASRSAPARSARPSSRSRARRPTACCSPSSTCSKDRKPDIVLSGVNRGTNMADDVTYSGTIAGAMEGCLLGIPSIAFSQAYTHPHPVKWGTATHARRRRGAARAGDGLAAQRLGQRQLPRRGRGLGQGHAGDAPGRARLRRHIVERTDPRGGAYYWIGYTPRRARARRGERPRRRALTATSR